MWDGGFIAVGQADGIVPTHEHHAIQIVLAVEGRLGIRGGHGDWRMTPAFIVRPDVVHTYNANGAVGALMFIDPESAEGVWLKVSLRDDITMVPESRLATCATELRKFLERPLESLEIGALVRHCVYALCAGAPPSRRLDERVSTVLAAIRQRDELRMSIEDAAALAFLSPSRFAHLVIGRDETISTAAHEADFADAAHLTRTFYQMFGMPPSALMTGQFFEIPSPFDVSTAGKRTAALG
jgi:AraC family transcriptional regulator